MNKQATEQMTRQMNDLMIGKMTEQATETKIEYLFHISDIHIMKNNYKNLKSSFKKLIMDIQEVGVEKSVLVIAGDVFEHKSVLPLSDIVLWFDICKQLHKAKIKTLAMCGNHDYNINSEELLDSVTVLTEDFKYDRIVCVNSTQVISGSVFGDPSIDFYIFSPIDNVIPVIDHVNINNKKIAVVHETINGSQYDNGTVSKKRTLGIDNFKEFDY